MTDADEFAASLLEEAKRFLEKSNGIVPQGEQAYLHASLCLGICALEAHTNAISAEFAGRPEFSVPEKSILLEQDYELQKGEFRLLDRLKMWRLHDRIFFLATKVGQGAVPQEQEWWSSLAAGIDRRNQLVHPKGKMILQAQEVERVLHAVISCLDFLYKAIYGRKFPGVGRQLQSNMDF